MLSCAKHLHVHPTYPCRILACVWQSSGPPRPLPLSEPPGWWDWTDPDPPTCPPSRTRCPWYRTRGCGAGAAAVVAAAPGRQTPRCGNPEPRKECRLHRAAGTGESRSRSLRIRYRAVSADGEETPLSRKVMQKKQAQRERLLETIAKPLKMHMTNIKVFLEGISFVKIGQNIIYCLGRKTAIGRKKEQHMLVFDQWMDSRCMTWHVRPTLLKHTHLCNQINTNVAVSKYLLNMYICVNKVVFTNFTRAKILK